MGGTVSLIRAQTRRRRASTAWPPAPSGVPSATCEIPSRAIESTMKAVDADELAAFRARIRERLAGLGEPYGLAAAELFARISDL